MQTNSIALLISLVGAPSVGKTYFLFSLGRVLVRYPTFRQRWIVTEVSDAYHKQIDIWSGLQKELGKLPSTELGTQLQLSFDLF